MYNEFSLDTICGALCYAAGIEPPATAAAGNRQLCDFIDSALKGKKADRIFIYNPDAVAEWIVDKYPEYLKEVFDLTQAKIPLRSVMPSVTPVCFGTFYTGVQPEVHGIRKYEKPVIKTDSFFDALIRQGKRVAIVAEAKSSMAMIFLERDMDYFIYDTIAEVNAKALRLIAEDEYDVICVYNGNYDGLMHKFSPEGARALAELRCNTEAFATFVHSINYYWKKHNTLYGYAMDHGCHEIDGECGSHGLDMEEDINIRHYYGIHNAE
jgi:hypothetical protein